MSNLSPIQRACLDQFVISALLVGIAWYVGGQQQAASTALGALLMTFNLGALTWTWGRLFEKKSIALAGAIIVIKYAIFGVILFWITRQTWIQVLWLLAGVITIIPTALLYSLRSNSNTEQGP